MSASLECNVSSATFAQLRPTRSSAGLVIREIDTYHMIVCTLGCREKNGHDKETDTSQFSNLIHGFMLGITKNFNYSIETKKKND